MPLELDILYSKHHSFRGYVSHHNKTALTGVFLETYRCFPSCYFRKPYYMELSKQHVTYY